MLAGDIHLDVGSPEIRAEGGDILRVDRFPVRALVVHELRKEQVCLGGFIDHDAVVVAGDLHLSVHGRVEEARVVDLVGLCCKFPHILDGILRDERIIYKIKIVLIAGDPVLEHLAVERLCLIAREAIGHGRRKKVIEVAALVCQIRIVGEHGRRLVDVLIQ